MPITERVPLGTDTVAVIKFTSASEADSSVDPNIIIRVHRSDDTNIPESVQALYALLTQQDSNLAAVIAEALENPSFPAETMYVHNQRNEYIQIDFDRTTVPETFTEGFIEAITDHIRTAGERLPGMAPVDTYDVELLERAEGSAKNFIVQARLIARLSQAATAGFLCNQVGRNEETIRERAREFLGRFHILSADDLTTNDAMIERLTDTALTFSQTAQQGMALG